MSDHLPVIALAQMEVHAGQPDRNVASMLEFIERARAAKATIVAFPELCIPGYILGDTWEIDALVEDYEGWSTAIRDAGHGITIVFGNVAIDRRTLGEDGRMRKLNAAWVCHDGFFIERAGLPAPLPYGVQPKTLHPNYRFFDDDRHFYSLRKIAAETDTRITDWMVPYDLPTEHGTIRLGVQLCEDIWYQDYRDHHGALDTLQAWYRAGADLVINLSASPWTWQKNDKRNRVIREAMTRSPVPFFYVNQVGAQNNGKNILVFDGGTCGYRTDGTLSGRAPHWREALLTFNRPPTSDRPADIAPAQRETRAIHDAIVTGLHHLDQMRGGDTRYLIGVSGGIDSSVVACLLRMAFGPERVFAVNMPTRFNADITRENARAMCAALAIDYLSCPIEDLYRTLSAKIRGVEFEHAPGTYTRLVDENLQARIRGADMLAGIAAKCGCMFTNNSNKTEIALGYATLYGDVNGAIAPIADLYKTQLFALARYLNDTVFQRTVIPTNLIDGEIVPSAELSDAQDVTRGLGDPIKYGYHDALLRQIIEYRRHPLDFLEWYRKGELLERIGWNEPDQFRAYFLESRSFVADLEWVDEQIRINYFKRIQAPPIIVLSKRAFGFDLRECQLPAYTPRAYERAKQALLEAD